MKSLFFLIGLSCVVNASKLSFENASKEVHADSNASTVKVDFKFSNPGKKPIRIAKVDAGCSCMTVKVSEGKLKYGPGESGIFRATFEIGTFQGAVDKTIHIWLDGDPETKPSQSVNLRVHIPIIIALEPKTLKWDTGGPKTTKSIRVKMDYGKPIHVKDVSTSNSNFTTKLVTVEDGKEYLIEVTPTQTEKGGLSVIRIETDAEVSKQKIQQAFAIVRAPIKK
ncbi:MAG: DUF1573 domain-containing protein [Akkermansiaceae bacterium]